LQFGCSFIYVYFLNITAFVITHAHYFRAQNTRAHKNMQSYKKILEFANFFQRKNCIQTPNSNFLHFSAPKICKCHFFFVPLHPQSAPKAFALLTQHRLDLASSFFQLHAYKKRGDNGVITG